MTLNSIKYFAITVFVLPLAAIFAFGPATRAELANSDDNPAAVFKAKCAACHSPKAEKFYDPSKPMDEQIEAVLKGKKGEKPPYMPGFEAKGMTPDQAKALVEYMKALREPSK